MMINDEVDSELESLISSSPKGWERICLHASPESGFHAMVMIMRAGVKSGFHWRDSDEIIVYLLKRGRLQISVRKDDQETEEFVLSRAGQAVALKESDARDIANISSKDSIYYEFRGGPYTQGSTHWVSRNDGA